MAAAAVVMSRIRLYRYFCSCARHGVVTVDSAKFCSPDIEACRAATVAHNRVPGVPCLAIDLQLEYRGNVPENEV